MKLGTYLNSTVARSTHVAPTVGDVIGIELELEGRGVGLADQPTKGWRRTQDGSLRGESVEFVLSKPELIPEATKAVNHLFKKLHDNNVVFNDSVRTSTHVHLNFADKPMRQAINFFCLFTMLEEVLEFYSGEDRAGNLFCLSSRRTDEIARILEQSLRQGNLNSFAGDAYKYAACNLSTLFKFGTVEIRTMRGANSAEQVNKWVAILEDMYNFAINNIEGPTDLIVELSHSGGEGFLRKVFRPVNMAELSSTIPAGTELYRSLLDGARLIQPLAYEFDEAFRFRPDPNKVEKVAEIGGRLRRRDLGGHEPIVIRLDGNSWHCTGAERIGDYWRDGECCTDSEDVTWNEAEMSFQEYDEDLDEVVNIPFHHARPIERFLV